MNQTIAIEQDKPLWGIGEVLRLSWPAGLSMLNGTIMMFVDGMMVARTGPAALGAQFVGGIMSFVPCSFALGMVTVVNTYVSQNFGAGRSRRCGQYVWAGLAIVMIYSLLVQVLQLPARGIFELFGHAPQMRAFETMYFRYMLLGIGFMLAARVLEQFFFGIGRPLIVLFSSLVGNLVNVGANYALIFGKFGLPAMGLEGAALGTLAGEVVLVGILACVFFRRSLHERFATRIARAMQWRHCRQILKIGWPAGLQFATDILSWSLFTAVLVGLFGTNHLAANTAAIRYMAISFMPAVGIGIATTALVGRYIGAGRPDLARKRTHAALIAAMAYMGFCAVVFFLFRHQLIDFYVRVAPDGKLSPAQAEATADQIVTIGGRLLLCAAMFQVGDAMAIIFNSALRGAGDTLWPMILTMVLNCAVLAGGGCLMVYFFPQLESLGPWIAAGAFILVLGGLLCWRFESGAWRKINLLAQPAGAPTLDSTMEL